MTLIMKQKLAAAALSKMLKKEEEPVRAVSAPTSVELEQLRMQAAEISKENVLLKEKLTETRAELLESKKNNEILNKKLDGLNAFVKRIGGSTEFMLKGSTSFFRKENQTLKTKVSHTNKSLSDIKRLNEDLVKAHELDRRAIEELSATISDLEFRIRMGVVSDEYTDEYCKAAHDMTDSNKTVNSQVCENCDVLKLQLSKNSISVHCLIGRLKQMEEQIFQLKNDKRNLINKLAAQNDANFKF